MGRIVWLASYPKSGNTWVRAFLTSYLSSGDAAADINRLIGSTAASRLLFDELAGVEASDLTADEVSRHRPDVYRLLAAESTGDVFLKVHDAAICDGRRIIPADVPGVAIYIVRNPLDVVVSLANHFEQPVSVAVDYVCDGLTLAANGSRLRSQLEQMVLSWGAHVRAWLDDADLRVECVRYEDLRADPVAGFARIVGAIQQSVDEGRLAKAIDGSAFGVLQAQERTSGFVERGSKRTPFFRQGRVNQWREVLADAQVERIVTAHRQEMIRLGYLP